MSAIDSRTDARFAADFTLAGGGLLDGVLRRVGLADRPLAQVLAFAAVAWVPLLILSALQGFAVGDAVRVPFLQDYGAYGRLLVALPVLLLAEVPIGRRTRDVLREFIGSRIVREADTPLLNATVLDATRRKESVLPEIAILALVYAGTLFRAHNVLSESLTTWYRTGEGTSLAALYYAFASLPVFQFLLLRWAWRLFLWTALLWRINRMDLQLLPIHPDRMGGLGFLGLAQIPFGLIGFAGGAVMASHLANGMVYEGASLAKSGVPMFVYVVMAALVILAPVLVFTLRLMRLRASGILTYGDIGAEYARLFHRKWAEGVNPEGESILGTSDIQSLADLRNSFDIVQNMSVIAADRKTIVAVVAAAAVPMVPLLFLAFPFEQIIARLLGLTVK